MLVLGVTLASACVHNSFTATTTMALASRPEGCYLDMIFEGVPPYASATAATGAVTPR